MQAAKRLEEVRCLAVLTTSRLQHAEKESELAQQTALREAAGRGNMLERQVAQQRREPVQLQQRVGIRVCNVRFKAGEFGAIIEPI